MKKLYDKSEITFAIVLIVIYTVSMGTLRNLGDDSPWMTAGLAVISAAMYLFVRKNGLTAKYGLDGWSEKSRAMLWFIPLWLISTCNLWGGVSPKYPMPGLVFAAVSMALVGFAEELIFRGFLFRAMLKDGSVKTAVIVSSVTFGLGHILNLLTGHGLAETLLQAVFAVAIGFAFTLAYYKGGSLLPCVLAHSLIDVFSLFSSDKAPAALNTAAHAFMVVTAVIYCLYLIRRVETPDGAPRKNPSDRAE